MKDILQTIYLKLNPTLLVHILICLHFSCILHIEPVAQDGVAEEVEASEVEVHEELQEREAAEQIEEQDLSDFTNPDQQPGKHRFIYPRVLHKFKFGASTGSIQPSVLYFYFKL